MLAFFVYLCFALIPYLGQMHRLSLLNTCTMKALLFILVIILALILCYFLLIRISRSRASRRINKILLNSYLGDSIDSIEEYISKTKFEITLKHIEKDGFKYIITNSPTFNTTKVYQFLNNMCVSFVINSSEERYSLPYWKHIKEYVKYTERFSDLISPKDDKYQLALYTVRKYFEPFEDQKIQSLKKLDYFFGEFYKIKENRYLSIELDEKESLTSAYPVYMFLCSCQIDYFEIFREQLFKMDTSRVVN